MNVPLRWHLLCQVIDNFGDAGVMWRLARQLRDEHGCQVHFFIDQPDILQKLTPESFSGTPADDFSDVTGVTGTAGTSGATGATSAAGMAGATSLPDETPQSGASRRQPQPEPQSPDHGLAYNGLITVHPMENGPALVEGADVVVCGFQVRLPDRARAMLRQLSSPKRIFPPEDVSTQDEPPAPCRNRPHTPTLIQLEYLSAEDWVEDGHTLPSLQPDGLIEYFFNPGFTPQTGGLLRERNLLAQRDAFLADPQNPLNWLHQHGVPHLPGDILISVLCYASAPLLPLLHLWLAEAPPHDLPALPAPLPPIPAPRRLHLLIPGAQTQPWLAPLHALAAVHPDRLRLTPLPFLPQPEFDPLLWSCDLNLVRGEDSWLRALWAGKPWLWQAYPQTEATHLEKLDAFLARCDSWATSPIPQWHRAMRAWNGAPAHSLHDVLHWLTTHSTAAPHPRAFHTLANTAARHTPSLSTQLVAFASSLRSKPPGQEALQRSTTLSEGELRIL